MTAENTRLSELHTATCFLNALLREWHNYFIYQSSDGVMQVVIHLAENSSLVIPLRKYSILGRHEYLGQFYLDRDNHKHEINFDELLAQLSAVLQTAYQMSEVEYDKFKSVVLLSKETVYHSLEYHRNSDNELKYDNDFIHAEQSLLVGHNFHPTPKSRDIWTLDELKSYAPEFNAAFSLYWILVDKDICHQSFSQTFAEHDWLLELFSDECGEAALNKLHENTLPIPMHPWQWMYLHQQNKNIQEYIDSGKIKVLTTAKVKWFATSSLRTLYREDSKFMLKFSMSIKLTNSVRILLTSEVARGLVLHDALATDIGQTFLAECPTFNAMTEPASVCLLDHDGNPIEETIIVARINTLINDGSDNKYMLATLLQDDPFAKQNCLLALIHANKDSSSFKEKIKKWFAEYLRVVIEPFVIAYAKYGIIMECHQQNIVLELNDGMPSAVYFRDCQDHAYSQLGYQLFADDIAELKNNPKCVADERIGMHYFIYQVFINSTCNVISTLAKSNVIHEIELFADLHQYLQALCNTKNLAHDFIDILLNSHELLQKCNFRFATSQINDNQVPCDPLELYTSVPNLIAISQLYQKSSTSESILYQRYYHGIGKTITLRKCESSDDIQQFVTWQKQPHIAKYWQLHESTQQAVAHLQMIMADNYQLPVIIEINHVPAGYAELYWAQKDIIADHYDHHDNDRGFHLLIGEKHLLGVEHTSLIFTTIMDYLYLDSPETKRIVVEPDKRNHRFIKYMDLLPGWRFIKHAELTEKNAAIYLHDKNYIERGVV